MSLPDQWIKIITVLVILMYLAVWAVGYTTNKLLLLTAVLNVAAGSVIIAYRIIKELSITQYSMEGREIVFFCFEAVVICCALYYIAARHNTTGMKVMQYLAFGIHLSALILFLIFMLTFRINKLF